MRQWSIREQVIVEPSVKLRFEFTSVHSQCMAKGEEAPAHDRAIMLNVYNETGNRVIRFDFTRDGDMVASTVEAYEEEVPQSDHEVIATMVRGMEVVEPRAEGPVADPPDWAGINVAGQFASDI